MKQGVNMEEEPKKSYERYLQEDVRPYKIWIEDMYLANSDERSEAGEAQFNTSAAYEKHFYQYLQERYTNFCEAQYNLYINDGEIDIQINLFDD
jgi:hypothetical protein